MNWRPVSMCLSLVFALGPLRAQSDTQWYLAWSDEFNAAKNAPPDPARWAYDNPNAGSSNHEFEIYCGKEGSGRTGSCANWQQNVYHDGDGHLVISAVKVAGGQWTSGRLLTQGIFSFTYGRAEARIKLPVGPGIWPAFWTLGNNISSVGWPKCGEQDIMENVPALGSSVVRSTLHGPGYSGSNSIGQNFNLPSGQQIDTDFHTYGMIWSPNKIQFYVDDYRNPFVTYDPSNLPNGTTWAYNDHPFFLLLNLAIGGDWPGAPSASTPNPANMLVDWVRVYQTSPAASNKLTSVSAASYSQQVSASPESIVTGFGQGWDKSETTEVEIQDSAGSVFPAPLYYVYPQQLSYLVPAGVATGAANVTVLTSGNAVASGTLSVTKVAPGLFGANADGQGPAAAQVLRVDAGGNQVYDLAAQFDATQNKWLTKPIDLGPETDKVYLILYGTGIRGRSALNSVQVKAGDIALPVFYAGSQNQFAGLDQLNIGPLPRTLQGKGTTDLIVTVEGSPANPVQISIK